MSQHGSSPRTQPRPLTLYVIAVAFGAAAVIASTFLHAEWRAFSGAKPAAVVIFSVLLIVGEARPLKWLRLNDGGDVELERPGLRRAR